MRPCRAILTLLFLALAARATAQLGDAFDNAYDLEFPALELEALADELDALRLAPANVNDSAEMAALPLLTDQQRRALRFYIRLHGELLTLDELRFVAGWDSATRVAVSPLLHCAPADGRRRWRQVLADGRHSLTTGLAGTVEQAVGYADGRLEGDNLRALLLYRFAADGRVDFRLAADKDPAEPWLQGNYIGAHLMLRDLGPVETLLLGRFSAQFGQGLTLWTGYAPYAVTGHSPQRTPRGLRPASAFAETGVQQGAAATVRLWRGLRLSALASDADGERLAAAHAEWRSDRATLGLTASHTRLDSPAVAYDTGRFEGSYQTMAGIDAAFEGRRFSAYGEASVDLTRRAAAAVGGLRLTPDSRNSLGLSFRLLPPDFDNLHAAAYAVGSRPRNEQGISLDARLQLPARWSAQLSLDQMRTLAPTRANRGPSPSTWLRLVAERPLGRHGTLTVRYSSRLKDGNRTGATSAAYESGNTLRQLFHADIRHGRGPWAFSARLSASRYVDTASHLGLMAAAEGRYNPRRLLLRARATFFSVDGYGARIYPVEANLPYFHSFTALSGRGVHGSALVQWQVSRTLSLGAQGSLVRYLDRTSIGSGASATTGPLRRQWRLELQWRF